MNTKTCPFCNEVIENSATLCPICCEALPVVEVPEEYHCPYCNEVIDPTEEVCPICCEVLSVGDVVKEFRCPCCNEVIDSSAEICPICFETIVSSNVRPNIENNTVIQETNANIQKEEYTNKSFDINSATSQYYREDFSTTTDNNDVTTDFIEQEQSDYSNKQINNHTEYMNKVDSKQLKKCVYIILGIIALIIAFITISFINNPTYKSIKKYANIKYYEYPTRTFELMTNINQQGTDLLDFLKTNKSNHKKDMVFGTYFRNLKFYSWVLAHKITNNIALDGVRFAPPANIVEPRIPVYKIEMWDEEAEFVLRINYDYLISTYSEYLGDEWNEILKISKKDPRPLEDLIGVIIARKKEMPNSKEILKLIKESPSYKVTQQPTISKEKKIDQRKSAAKTQPVTKTKPVTTPKSATKQSTHVANHTPSNNLKNKGNTNSIQKATSASDKFRKQWDEINRQKQPYNNSYNNYSQRDIARDTVWRFINTDVGINPNYGIDKQRFSQASFTQETIEEIYQYVKYRVNNYEEGAEIIKADVNADLKAGKIFYNFYIKEKSSGEIIKLPVWTIRVQPRFDL